MFFLSFLTLVFLLVILFNFHKKLLDLLMLEACMLFLVVDLYLSFLSHGSNSSAMVILTIFLVLDSVLGLCLLINSTRYSSFLSPFRFSI